METVAVEGKEGARDARWLTPGVVAIGSASLLADMGHEIPTVGLPAATFVATMSFSSERGRNPR